MINIIYFIIKKKGSLQNPIPRIFKTFYAVPSVIPFQFFTCYFLCHFLVLNMFLYPYLLMYSVPFSNFFTFTLQSYCCTLAHFRSFIMKVTTAVDHRPFLLHIDTRSVLETRQYTGLFVARYHRFVFHSVKLNFFV